MIRRLHGLRQYYRAIRHIAWPHIEGKKLLWAGAATALALSGGAVYLSQSKTDQPAQQNDTQAANTSTSHPLLGLNDASSSTPKEQESPTSGPDSHQNAATDDTKNEAVRQTTVTINGESIEVPPSGSSHQTIKNADGSQTEVDIQHEQIQVNGTSRSNITIDSQSKSSNSSSTSLNSRITITH